MHKNWSGNAATFGLGHARSYFLYAFVKSRTYAHVLSQLPVSQHVGDANVAHEPKPVPKPQPIERAAVPREAVDPRAGAELRVVAPVVDQCLPVRPRHRPHLAAVEPELVAVHGVRVLPGDVVPAGVAVGDRRLGINPIVTLEKQLPNMIVNLV